MSLTVGSNSYATVAEADTYLEDRIGASGWFSLSETTTPGGDSKESMLVSAYYWLTGSASLNLPAVSSSSVLKTAQIESALYLLEFYSGLSSRRAKQSQGVESFKLSDRSEKYFVDQPSEIPVHILGLLDDYSGLGGQVFQLKGQYDV